MDEFNRIVLLQIFGFLLLYWEIRSLKKQAAEDNRVTWKALDKIIDPDGLGL
jgi:hypothetical protein